MRIAIRSDWSDEQEPTKQGFEMESLPAACTPKPSSDDGETFEGTSRELAKTEIAEGDIESVNLTVRGFHASHPSDLEMQQLHISRRCNSLRREAEERNVTVAAYLVAAKKEEDNDYHLILQDKDCQEPACRLTVEVSGVPRLAVSRGKLKAARQYFEEQWPLYTGLEQVPGSGKYLFFATPILIRVTGSAFYDTDHEIDLAKGTGPVGPEGYKPGSAWEVHPVTSFEFDPRTERSLFVLLSRNSSEPATAMTRSSESGCHQ